MFRLSCRKSRSCHRDYQDAGCRLFGIYRLSRKGPCGEIAAHWKVCHRAMLGLRASMLGSWELPKAPPGRRVSVSSLAFGPPSADTRMVSSS